MSKLLFVDLGKRGTDLITKDFPDKTKVEVNTRTGNGVVFQTTATRNSDGSVIGSLQPKYTFVKQGVTATATLDTNRLTKGELTFENILPRLKLTATAASDAESFKTDLEWKHERATFTTGVDFFAPKGTNVQGTGAVHYEGISVGVSAEYLISDKQELKKIDGVVAFTTPDLQITAFSRRKFNTFGGSYFQRVSDKTNVSAEIVFDLAKPDLPPKLTLAASEVLDPATATLFKAKFDTEGLLSVAYSQKLNAFAKLVIGSNINTNNLGGTGNHKLGFNLTLDL